MKNFITKIMLLGCITSNMTYSNTNITDTIKEHWPTARQATFDIANLYARYFIATFSYGLGHMLAVKLLCNQSTRIVLGTPIDTGSKLPLSIGGFNPLSGVSLDFDFRKDTPMRNALCSIAGPIASAITTWIINKYTDNSLYAIKTPILKPFKNLYYGFIIWNMHKQWNVYKQWEKRIDSQTICVDELVIKESRLNDFFK